MTTIEPALASPVHIVACERILAEALQPVATELRMVDLQHWIAYIHNGDSANLRDLILSSAELHFRPGALDFSGFADSLTNWCEYPVILLNLELILDEITAFLQLKLRPNNASVDLLALSGQTQDVDLPLKLERALSEARTKG